MPPVDTGEYFLHGPRDWLWFGLLRRLWFWLFRVRGGFGRSSRAVVSFVHIVGSRLVLILVVPRGSGVVFLNH